MAITPMVGAPGVSDGVAQGCTAEQLTAVRAPPHRHYLVLAGAGCGKTTVLTCRIVYLSNCGIDYSRILALTFTRKAAENMSGRLRTMIGALEPENFPTITTFHAFALSILAMKIDGTTNFRRIGFQSIPRCCTERERLELLSHCSTCGERELLTVDIIHLDALIERLKVFPDFLHSLPPEHSPLLQKIAGNFKILKQREGVWDFSDLIDGAVKLFCKDSNVRDLCRRRYSAVLVDEFQDTNPLQIKLLNQILGKDISLFAVGDDDQAIYAFRGADRRPTLSFPTFFPGAEIFKLQTNFRSTPAILKRANAVFVDKDPVYRKVLISGKKNGNYGERPSIHRFIHQESLAGWIVRQRDDLSKKTGIPWKDMAILFRINQSAEWMRNYLAQQGISPDKAPQILTIHKSKGLEFPVVFLCDMEESVFPLYRLRKARRIRTFFDLFTYLFSCRKKAADFDLDEERRLFYVAMTRAQHHLFLLYAQKKHLYGRYRKLEPSRFLKYLQ
jgi:superfamily I DNA/RNA helicase